MRENATLLDDTLDDPQPRFPSDAELALAERLRRKIEERYLGRPAVPEAAQAPH
jgi:hypothetical protein